MGQRHQIYVRLPKKYYYPDNPNNRDEVTIGIHHQWLYGQRAILQLNQLLQFIDKRLSEDKDDYMLKDVGSMQGLLESCYSLNALDGYYHNVCDITDETDVIADPRNGDNNDGITVIDLSGNKPTYCFVSLHGIEATKQPKAKLKPISAEEYYRCYYPIGHSKSNEMVPEFHVKSEACLQELRRFDVISLERLKKIFPEMYPKARKSNVKLLKVEG